VAGAVVVCNAIVAFTLLNIAACPLTRGAAPSPVDKYGLARLRIAYPGWTDAAIRELLDESFVRFRLVHHPLTQFRNGPFRGRYVNVESAGFRSSGPDEADPTRPGRPAVFFFGGSTAFGLGVRDDETIAAALERELRRIPDHAGVRVFNFGTPAYFSSQELALFTDLLRSGMVPDVAVFLDGLNEFFYSDGRPEFTDRFAHCMRTRASLDPLYELPATKVAMRVKQMLSGSARSGGLAHRPDLAAALERWQWNRRAIEALGRAHGIRVAFVWQPVPTYRYEPEKHFLFDGSPGFFEGHQRSGEGYRLAEVAWRGGRLGEHVLWLGDIQEREGRNLYVDKVHYSAEFSRELGGRIARFLVESRFL
jgi:hypothetical protein